MRSIKDTPARSAAPLVAAGALLLFGACGGDSPATGNVDATADATAPMDVAADAGPSGDVTPDTAPDTATDSAPDTATDSATDTAADTGADAGPDTGTDTGTDTETDTATDTASGWSTCETDADCADNLACTADACVDTPQGRRCQWTVQANACLIHNVCRGAGEPQPDNPCAQCRPEDDPTGWSPRPDGYACSDANTCTKGDQCVAGACVPGEAMDCDDGDPCTDEQCDPVEGCIYAVNAAGCDDGDPCTTGDVCTDGVCAGQAVDCDDGDPCTDDVCDETGACTHGPNTAPCDDGDPCTDGDACAEGVCVPGGPTVCDDGNACTLDSCDALVGCVFLPTQSPCCIGATSICDDGDPCTDDFCDPDTAGCSYSNNTAPCDDGDACTEGDTCADGACGGADVACDDGNDCTADSCNPTVGCVATPVDDGAPCDDGLACSTGDACVAGACVAGDTSQCVCTPTFDDAGKLTALAIGDGGYPGEGLDLDHDPTTCAPAGSCSDGVQNALGIIASMVNDSIASSVGDGSLLLTLEFQGMPAAGDFTLALYTAQLDPANAGCDTMTATCDYLADSSMIDQDTCAALVQLPGSVTGSHVEAGGQDTIFPFTIPMSQGVNLEIVLYAVQLEATVTRVDGQVTGFDGVLGGAVPKDQLLSALNALPAGSLPVDVSLVELLLNSIDDDVDTNGDGVNDALSIGIKLSGIDGNLVGVAP